MSKLYGYARVSSKEQNLSRQLEALKEYDENIIMFEDKASGKDFDRNEYEILKRVASFGDTIVIKEMDRLGRNKALIKQELEYFKEKGVRIVILDIPTTTMDISNMEEGMAKAMLEMINNILIEVLSTIAESERDKIKQRQKEGIKSAKEKGKHIGRPKAEFPYNWNSEYNSWKEGQQTAKVTMDNLGLKRTTFYKLVNQQEN